MDWEFLIIYCQIFNHFEAILAEQNQQFLLDILMLVVPVLISGERISKILFSKSSLSFIKNDT